MQQSSQLSEMEVTKIAIFLFSLILNDGFLHIAGATLFPANETDQFALLAIKSNIFEDRQGVMTSWNHSVHHCEWIGVTCGHRHKRVTILDLSSKELVGFLSPHVGNLSFLKELRLSHNTLGGEIPHEVGRLFRLQILHLHNNSFEGEIPTNISHCANLTSLFLAYNKLVGGIPKEFNSLFNLKQLYIRNNNLSGEIPPFLGNLTSLEIISFGYCQFWGSIPNVFQNLRSLRYLVFEENHLNGTIPSSIYNLSSLEILSGTGNQLRGSLPTSFPSKLPYLLQLALGLNHFTGSLPPSISNCSNLKILDFANNNLTGEVLINFGNHQDLIVVYLGGNNFVSGEHDEMKFLDSLSNCSNLRDLDISLNRFRGRLPNSLGNFSTKLESLWLGMNSFYGRLPLLIGNLFKLTSLSLSENQFTGTIPFTIGKLQKLRELKLFRNSFSGKIPNSVGNLSLLVHVEMSYNKLEGTIPSSIGNCHNLQYLSFFQNTLSGSIPKQIFELSSISIVLDLGRNNLSGPLPIEVGSLKNLGILAIAENHLSGELPSSLGSCSSLEFIDLSSNSLQGSIPTSLDSLRAVQSINLSHNNFSGIIPCFFEKNSLEMLDMSFNNFEGEVPVVGVFTNSSKIFIEGNPLLCGGKPELQLPKCNLKHSTNGHKKLPVWLMIVIPIASALIGIAILLFILFCWCTKKRKDQPSGLEMKESFLKVSFERLLKATNGFSSENLIGVGAFASVYKGVIDDYGKIVAVKVLNLQHRGGAKSFMSECEALRRIRHRNLVKVITSCSSVDFQGNDFKALVYEYMPNGTLDQWLHSRLVTTHDIPQCSLLDRISIAIDVASAIDYLHNHSGNPVIHCDLKPSNILLDGDMVAHVGDFGLAMFLLPELSTANPSSSTRLRGTIGYAPPEYGLGNDVSKYGDVYSYGIILLEMVTGRKPTDYLFQEGLNLHNWVSMALAKGEMEIVEPILWDEKNKECLISMLMLGVACSLHSPQERIDISRVIHELRLLREKIIRVEDRNA